MASVGSRLFDGRGEERRPATLAFLALLGITAAHTLFAPVADRLLAHADAEVRTAALRARAAVEHDATFLRGLLDDPQPEIRATALVALAAGGDLSADDTEARMRELSATSVDVRRALTRALGEARPPLDPRRTSPATEAARAGIEHALPMLASDEDASTRVGA